MRMARQNLLDQRRARARHAENEDRHRDGSPPPASLARISSGVNTASIRSNSAMSAARRSESARASGIAAQQMLEAAPVILDVGVGLAEREIELHPVGIGQRHVAVAQRLHRRQVRIVRRELLRIRRD